MSIGAEKAARSSGYLSTLDGWRACAVFSVIAYHDRPHQFGMFSDKWLHEQGFLGVDLFFAISGLLICSRILDDENKLGRISLTDFYIRRTFRIVPAMVGYLAIIAFLGSSQLISVNAFAWTASLLFFLNYLVALRHVDVGTTFVAHFWSLAVEEHFYLVLPSVLKFLPARRLAVLGYLSAGFLIWSLVHTIYTKSDALRDYADHRTDLRIFELFFPALIAVLVKNQYFRNYLVRYLRPWATLIALVGVCMLAFRFSHTLVYRVAVPIGFPFVILSTVLHPQSIVGRALELPPLRAIGRISFSIYLWQQLFFIGESPLSPGLLGILQSNPWNLIATLTAATLSYYLLEKPMMRLGHRIAPPATPGHRDLATRETLNA